MKVENLSKKKGIDNKQVLTAKVYQERMKERKTSTVDVLSMIISLAKFVFER